MSGSLELPLLFDAHLDLSLNALEWNRDLTISVDEFRDADRSIGDGKKGRGCGTVSFPDMRRGRVGMCVATQIARARRPGGEFWSSTATYSTPEIAWAVTQAQLAWYQEMERAGHITQILNQTDLRRVAALWADGAADQPIGYVLSLEGADSLVTLNHLQTAYNYGLRALGPAHYGPGRFAAGTHSAETEGLTKIGMDLLRKMEELKMILDVTHLTDLGFNQALEVYRGPIWASHSNCRSWVSRQRQLSDIQIRKLLDRQAVIGVALDAWMLDEQWQQGKTTAAELSVPLAAVADHIDHICQLAGDCYHVGIGSDLDGGFGTEQCPVGIKTIADLQGILTILLERGYREEDLNAIAYGNWVRFLERVLPN